MTGSRKPVRAEASGSVLEITLDRPPANAIDAATSRALYEAFARLESDPDLRVGIVTAAECLIQRSEEHTSELQSHVNLVCRLLLEKKKKNPRFTKDYARLSMINST